MTRGHRRKGRWLGGILLAKQEDAVGCGSAAAGRGSSMGGEPKTNRRVEKLSVQLVSSLSCAVRPSALFYASVLVQLMCPSPV